ncbi:MAG: hypothetical protein TREMPRED_001782 [Tremellales sp. Tagirdzhanova-0007]|nr:MAG: hypothetical protein TREMPRED_001782 [Tremellales sp. Tagirdzhanova-0007]
MPQPPLEVSKYLASPLPSLREQYPPGTGGTGPRAEWPEGTLNGVQEIDDFRQLTSAYMESLPSEPIRAHPAHKYPKFVQAITTIPTVLKSSSDLQKCLSTLPLDAVSAVLTALEADASETQVGPTGAEALDRAGYESDGGEEFSSHRRQEPHVKAWTWRFNKSPLGSGEFLLVQQGSEDVRLVVRTINSAAFTAHDWEEFVVTGPYHYSTKSKASYYWSRTWGATKRLQCQYWVFTDWQRWTFGCFDPDRKHGWVSGVMGYDSTQPSVLQALTYWSQSAIGAEGGFDARKKDVSNLPPLFPANPSRRISVSHSRPKTTQNAKGVRAANESDIEESDVEGAQGE